MIGKIARLFGTQTTKIIKPNININLYGLRYFSTELYEDGHSLDQYKIAPKRVELLKKNGITQLYPIQAQCFDPVLNGENIIARAPTGQGKTLAFMLPILEKLDNYQFSRTPRVLILEPTRELAVQTFEEGVKYNIKKILFPFYGGVSYNPQIEKIRQGVDVIVATPGRLKDLLTKSDLTLETIDTIVIDEADRMLEIGFSQTVIEFLNLSINLKQLLLFSATLPDWVNGIISRYMKNPIKIDLLLEEKINADIAHYYQIYQDHTQLIQIINTIIENNQSKVDVPKILIFCPTKISCDSISRYINNSVTIHGNHSQEYRSRTFSLFKQGVYNVLIATDVAARGLDIDDINIVINIGNQQLTSEGYIHRSGRTGRKGKDGTSILLISQDETYLLNNLQRTIGIRFSPFLNNNTINNLSNNSPDKVCTSILNQISRVQNNDNVDDIINSLTKQIKKDDLLRKLVSKECSMLEKAENVDLQGLENHKLSYRGGNGYNNSRNLNNRVDYRNNQHNYGRNFDDDYNMSRINRNNNYRPNQDRMDRENYLPVYRNKSNNNINQNSSF